MIILPRILCLSVNSICSSAKSLILQATFLAAAWQQFPSPRVRRRGGTLAFLPHKRTQNLTTDSVLVACTSAWEHAFAPAYLSSIVSDRLNNPPAFRVHARTKDSMPKINTAFNRFTSILSLAHLYIFACKLEEGILISRWKHSGLFGRPKAEIRRWFFPGVRWFLAHAEGFIRSSEGFYLGNTSV